MSGPTCDRGLKPLREQTEARRGISTTKAGTLLKRQIAIRTFADWTDARPGFFEMDLVAHCGWSGAGPFLYTLSMVDVATGWVACAGLRDKREETVFHALQRIRAELPFRILGLDSDNGTEFINRALLDYCTDHHITFTRSRPYLKNDTCHVELCGYPHNSTKQLSFLRYGRPRVKVMRCWAQYSSSAPLRNSLPLSESGPRILNGSSSWTRRSAASTVWARLSRRPAQLTQPVATSTSVSVYRNGPAPVQPQWATRSTSTKPGTVSLQAAKVLMATWCFSRVPGRYMLTPRLGRPAREADRARSRVAGLMCATRSLVVAVTCRSACQCRSRWSNSGRNGASRLEQMPSVAAQHIRSNATSAGPYDGWRPR